MKCPIFFALPKENRIALTLFPKALPLKILHSQNQKGHPNFIFCPQEHIVLEIIPPPPAQNTALMACYTAHCRTKIFAEQKSGEDAPGEIHVGEALLRPNVQELCDRALIVALGYLDLVLWYCKE